MNIQSSSNRTYSKKLTIIIPAHNEEMNIGDLLDELNKIRQDDWEILVVNDGSDDNTGELARERGASVITHPYPMGNGAAIKSGMRAAQGEILIMMDGDGQHSPSDIPRFLEEIERYDMVVGARDWKGQSSIHRGIANRIYNLLASYVAHRRIPDLTSGFRAVKSHIAKKYIYMLPNSFSYPTTITLAMMKSGHSVSYIPISVSKRKGKSKISLFSDGTKFLLIITRIATVFSPFRVFLPISLFLFITGIFYYLYVYITTHRFTNMVLLLFLMSILVFLLGLISEQINVLRYDRTENTD